MLNSRQLIASDIALSGLTRPFLGGGSKARCQDQATFRRAASVLSDEYYLYGYLSTKERRTLTDAASVLRKLALASEHSKEELKWIEDRREAEATAREQQ